MGTRGQPTTLIDTSFPDPISETATTIPLPTPSISSDQPNSTLVFDPLRLLSPLEKDCPRLLSTSESFIRTLLPLTKNIAERVGPIAFTVSTI